MNRFRVVRTSFTILTLNVAALACNESASSTGNADVPVRAARALDSAEMIRKRDFDSTFKLSGDSSATRDSLRRYMALMSHMSLARLGYLSGPFDAQVTPALQEAIRSYERDRRLPVTGEPANY